MLTLLMKLQSCAIRKVKARAIVGMGGPQTPLTLTMVVIRTVVQIQQQQRNQNRLRLKRSLDLLVACSMFVLVGKLR